MMNNAGPYPRDAFDQERHDEPEDQHVMPLYGREHVAVATCWCKPRIDYRGPVDRVWVHRDGN